MPTYFATPIWTRQGVVAGFVFEAPVFRGIPQAASGPISFTFYNSNTTLHTPTVNLTIGTGFQHWVNIGGRGYNYFQQNGDSAATVAAMLAEYINAAADPSCTASSAGAVLTLTPRINTGAAVECTASETNGSETLMELTGNELIPTLTKGVLFAQGEMYAPALAPEVPAAPASQRSWLFYSSTTGWYWKNSATPNATGDACVGWVVTTATEIIAVSSRRVGTGAEAALVPGGPVAVQIGEAGDTGVPAAPAFDAAETSLQLEVGDLSLASDENTAGLDFAFFDLYYVNEQAGTGLTLTAALTAAAAAMSASGALPAAVPGQVTFTFYNATHGVITIGPGYVHSISIGALTYTYEQQTEDTAAAIATALADLIDASADENATATAVGATVVLTAAQNTGVGVPCSASDGNAAATLTETEPSYVVIDDEIIAVSAANGSAIARGQLGSTAAAHASGAKIWPVGEMLQVFALPALAYGTPAWPTVVGVVPWAGKALVAATCWVTNEIGPSASTTMCYTGQGPWAVDSLGIPLAPDVAAFTAGVTTGIEMAGSPYYQFSGTVETGLAPAGTSQINIVMTDGSGHAQVVATLQGPFTASDNLGWASPLFPQPTSGPTLTFQPTVVPWNVDLAPTVSARTVAPLTVGNGTGVAGSTPAEQPASVAVTETSGARTITTDLRQTWTTLTVTVEEAIAAPGGEQLGSALHLQVSLDDGATWTDYGTFASNRTTEDSTHTYFVTTLVTPKILVLAGTQQAVARAWSITSAYDPGPGAATASAAYGLAGMGLPAANLVAPLTISAGAGGSWPYNAQTVDGEQYYAIATVSYNDTLASEANNVFFIRITEQDLDLNHNPVGLEMPYAGTLVSASGQVQQCGGFMGDYETAGDGFVRSANVAYLRFRRYACNRSDGGEYSFQDASCATPQVLGGSDPGYQDVLVAAGGAAPAGALVATRIDPTTLQPNLVAGPNGLGVNTSDLSNVVLDPVFANGLTAWTGLNESVISGGAYTGNYRCKLDVTVTGSAQVQELVGHTCRPGDQIYAEAYVESDTGIGSGGFSGIHLDIAFFNAAGGQVAYDGGTGVGDTAGAWQKITNLQTAPANASTYTLTIYAASVNPPAGKYWYVDNVFAARQVSTGAGTSPDGNGGVQANPGYTIGFNASNQLVLENLQSLSSLPTLPSASYPAGSVILYTVDGYLYRTNGVTWTKQTDPASLAAGALASGVTVNAGQVNAGTFNGCQLILNWNNVTTSIQNQYNGTWVSDYVGLKCVNNTYGNFAGVLPSGFLAVASNGLQYGALGYASLVLSTPTGSSLGGLNLSPTQINVASSGMSDYGLFIRSLPSANPGAGTKQFWYDPSDSNRVKYAA